MLNIEYIKHHIKHLTEYLNKHKKLEIYASNISCSLIVACGAAHVPIVYILHKITKTQLNNIGTIENLHSAVS